MYKPICLYLMVLLAFSPDKLYVSCGGALGDAISTAAANRYNTHVLPSSEQHHKASLHPEHPSTHSQQTLHHTSGGAANVIGGSNAHAVGSHATYHQTSGSGHVDHRNSYNLLSEAMSQAVSNEFHTMGSGSADGACQADDLDCYTGNVQDRLGMEAIRTLHRQLDDDDNGNIDLSESDDFLREELKYDSGYEKRQKAFHFNDDMHISVKELWEAWLRSEVHNWTIEQTTDWLAQSVQLPQYVDLFKQHVVTGAALPRLAVNNMHYVSNVLGIKDPIHKQKIALKAMDVVLFGPPRETGTKWKDYILVTLLLSAIIGCWYAYQQNKNAKRHLRRMAQDMEGLQRAEQSLQEMQKELERARMEQENVATEKLDLERRLKEAPALSSSNSDLEVQKLKKEIEMLRTELSRAEIELVDNCWSPPPQLQSWLQYTYELESKSHLKKRVSAEKQLQCAREACEKLRKKRSSLVGAFVSTHGKSIDDVDRSIVEARTSLGEVTNELQERLHRWKQIESCLGLNIVNNNGLAYLESVLYGRGNGSNKNSRGRITSSTDDLDDDSVQGFHDNYSRISAPGGMIGSSANTIRDDSSCSDDGADAQSVQFYLGGTTTPISNATPAANSPSHRPPLHSVDVFNHVGNSVPTTPVVSTVTMAIVPLATLTTSSPLQQSPITPTPPPPLPLHNVHSNLTRSDSIHNILGDEGRHSPSVSSERSIPVPPRSKKQILPPTVPPPPPNGPFGKAPLPPPRKSTQSEIIRSQSTDLVPMEIYSYLSKQYQSTAKPGGYVSQQQSSAAFSSVTPTTNSSIKRGLGVGKMVKQHSNASQQSTSSTSSSVQSAPPNAADTTNRRDQSPVQLSKSSHERTRDAGDGESQNSHPLSSFIAKHSLSMQSLCGKSLYGGNNINTVVGATTSTSASFGASTHSNTQMEHVHQPEPTAVVSTSLESGDLKKRRRRLRFPFGGKKTTSNSSSTKTKPPTA